MGISILVRRYFYIDMMTSSNGNIFRADGFCGGNSTVTDEFPSQMPVMRSFNVFFDLCLNKRLNEQSWGWWFETPSCSLWRHCNVINLFLALGGHCYRLSRIHWRTNDWGSKRTWWRHQMETFSVFLALCGMNPLVTGGFPVTKASDADLWCVLWSAPEQPMEQTLETPVLSALWSLWRHCNTLGRRNIQMFVLETKFSNFD